MLLQLPLWAHCSVVKLTQSTHLLATAWVLWTKRLVLLASSPRPLPVFNVTFTALLCLTICMLCHFSLVVWAASQFFNLHPSPGQQSHQLLWSTGKQSLLPGQSSADTVYDGMCVMIVLLHVLVCSHGGTWLIPWQICSQPTRPVFHFRRPIPIFTCVVTR